MRRRKGKGLKEEIINDNRNNKAIQWTEIFFTHSNNFRNVGGGWNGEPIPKVGEEENTKKRFKKKLVMEGEDWDTPNYDVYGYCMIPFWVDLAQNSFSLSFPDFTHSSQPGKYKNILLESGCVPLSKAPVECIGKVIHNVIPSTVSRSFCFFNNCQ